ncbi:hypothetical protein D3C72_2465720 [compost metagenome]
MSSQNISTRLNEVVETLAVNCGDRGALLRTPDFPQRREFDLGNAKIIDQVGLP